MAVTLRKIADHLALSHATVSRVLGNPDHPLYTPETRERILSTAREMGYIPNMAARSLRGAKTNMIGIFGSPHGLWAGIGPEMARGISRVLHARKFDVFFAFSQGDDQQVAALPAWRYDGALVLQHPTQATIAGLLERKQPLVAVNERIAGACAVLSDENNGIRQAMEHLWELGHRRIAYFNVPTSHFNDHYSVGERHEAYLSFLRERGAEPIPGHDSISSRDQNENVRAMIQQQQATAAITYDHVVAVDVLAATQRLGMRVPDDFSLICVNNEFPVQSVAPPLTVIAPQGEEMGRLAALRLLEIIDGAPSKATLTEIRVSSHLILRESTAPPKS